MDDAEALAPLFDRTGSTGAAAHFACGELQAALGDAEFRPTTTGAQGTRGRRRRPRPAPLADCRGTGGRPAGRVRGGRPGARAPRTGALHQGAPVRRRPPRCAPHLRRRARRPGPDPARGLRRARHGPAARLAAQLDTDLAGALLLAGGSGGEAEAVDPLRAAEEVQSGASSSTRSRPDPPSCSSGLGEPARPMLSEALAALTTAEARVATLAAGGLTNREIAGQLIVTVKAVGGTSPASTASSASARAPGSPRASVSPDCSTRGHGRPAGESARLALRSPESAGLARHPGPSRRICPASGAESAHPAQRQGREADLDAAIRGSTRRHATFDEPGATPARPLACPAGTTRRLLTLPGGQNAPTRPSPAGKTRRPPLPASTRAESAGQSQRNHRPCPCASAPRVRRRRGRSPGRRRRRRRSGRCRCR